MAKMFYTVEEASKRLGCDEDKLRELSTEGRLREFRDGPRLMYKADQVDRLAEEVGEPCTASQPAIGAEPTIPEDMAQRMAGEARAMIESIEHTVMRLNENGYVAKLDMHAGKVRLVVKKITHL